MKYYWMIASTGKDIGNASSQVKSMSKGYDLYEDNSVWRVPRFKDPKFEPNFNSFVLNTKAKVTDFIWPAGLLPNTGFLISEKAKNLLTKFKLPNQLFYKAQLIHKDKIYDNYYWLQFIEETSNKINFELSTFSLMDSVGWQLWEFVEGNIKFSNSDELEKRYYEISVLKNFIPEKLYLTSKLDIYTFLSFGRKFLLSENLYKTLIDNNITGSEFYEFNINIDN